SETIVNLDGYLAVDTRGHDDYVQGRRMLVYGGDGNDTIDAYGESDIAGGKGNDVLSFTYEDVIAYNPGDGADVIVANGPEHYDSNPYGLISLGGGLKPEDVEAYIDDSGNLVLIMG